jgi:hypothetical protein
MHGTTIRKEIRTSCCRWNGSNSNPHFLLANIGNASTYEVRVRIRGKLVSLHVLVVEGEGGANSNDNKNYCLFFNANAGKIAWYFLLWSTGFSNLSFA